MRIAEQREQLRHFLVLPLPAGSCRVFNCFDLRGSARTRGARAHAPEDVINENPLSQPTLSLSPVQICQLRKGKGSAGGVEDRTEDLIRTSVCDKYSLGPFILPICTRCLFPMIRAIQVCSQPEYLPLFLVQMKSVMLGGGKDRQAAWRTAPKLTRFFFGTNMST